jgi:soluble lytic murein transglycosylase-like protein
MTDMLIALAILTAQRHHIDSGVFLRLITAESDWQADAVSATGCVGLGQISRAAWDWWPDDPFDPAANLDKAGEILRWNIAYRCSEPESERLPLAVASYTLGHGAVDKLLAERGGDWREGLSEPVRKYVDTITGVEP